MERARKRTDYTFAEERRGWNRAAMARRKSVNERPVDDVPATRENVTGENTAARSRQEVLIVVIDDNVSSVSSVTAEAAPTDFR